MKKNLFMSVLVMLTTGLALTSCKDDDSTPVIPTATLTIEIPDNLANVELSNAVTTITNVQTNRQQSADRGAWVKNGNTYQLTLTDVEEGNYNVAVAGHLDFTLNGIAGQKDFEVKSDNVKLTQQSAALKLAVSTFTAQGGFVISEIFFTGTTTPEGTQYSGSDQYIKIVNNSDVTLYADSIAVMESEFATIDKQDYTPDLMKSDFSVEAVYMIPGNGKSVAVEPGASLLLAINAINHKEANPNSMDLSDADFEFYDESSNPNFTDPDGKAPNLDKWYCYTATVYSFHNRGFHSIAIAKVKADKETWLKDYAYTAEYTFTFNEYSFPMSTDTYRVPNSWILDGVNLSIESMWQWNVLDASIDKSWTYCGKVDKDQNRYNKAVVRKQDANGKYVDTNNSTNDFEAEAVPTLLRK